MTFFLIAKLAWRNLWRNYWRTFIMLAAIVVGVWAMIFMTALMRGMVNNSVDNGLKTFVGHLQIHHENYLQDPGINNSLAPPPHELEMALTKAQAWTARVRVPAVISSERETRGVTLMGIEPQSEARVSFIAENIVAGRYLQSSDDKGVVIGRKLADKLDTELGKRIVLMSQDPENNIVDKGARIVGIFKADLSATEEQFVFMDLQNTQAFLKLQNQISEIEIVGEDFRTLESLQNDIGKYVDSPAELLRWDELQPWLASMLDVMDGFTLVWMLVVFIALSFGLINTLVMAVFERTREFGLMLALGMKPYTILLQVLVEAVFLLALGLFIGTALAYLSIQPLQAGIDISAFSEGMEMMGVSAVLYPSLYIKDIITANVLVIVLGIVASLLPAIKASHLNPVQSLNVT